MVMEKVKSLFRNKRGQNTVEYLMMLAVVVGVILIVGNMFKKQIGPILSGIMGKISGAADNVSQGGGN